MKKTSIFVLNAIIALIAIFAIASSFMFPLWKVKFSVTVTPELIEAIRGETDTDSSSEKTDEEELMENVIKALEEKEVSLGISLSLKSSDFLSVLFTQSSSKITKIVEKNVDDFMDEIDDIIYEIVETTVKASVKTITKKQITESVSNMISADEDADQVLKEAGITDKYIDEKTDEIFEAVKAEGATTESVTNTAMDMIDEVQEMLLATGKFDADAIVFDEATRAMIEDKISEFLALFADENGNINFEEALNDILSQIMSGALSADDLSSMKQPAPTAMMLGAKLTGTEEDDSEQTAEEKAEELRQEIKENIMNAIDEDFIGVFRIFMSAVAVMLLISMAMWAYIILKMICKIASDNPGVKLKAPIIFGWIPYLNLVLIPSLVLLVLKSPVMTLLSDQISFGDIDIESVLGAFKLSFKSSNIFAGISAAVLIVISFIYIPLRKSAEKR